MNTRIGSLVVDVTAPKSSSLQHSTFQIEAKDSGISREATVLSEKYGWDSEAMTGNIYPLVRQYLNGSLIRAELIERFIIADRQLAKRQLTWFKRDSNISWLSIDEANSYLEAVLSEHQS